MTARRTATDRTVSPHASGVRRTGYSMLAFGGAGVIALLLAACGGSNTVGAPPDQTGQATAPRPGASGKIAAVDAGSIQVQSTDSQTTVTYTSNTPITAQVSTTAATITTGACVSITSAAASTGGATNSSTPVTAETVQILPAVNGACSFNANSAAFGGRSGTGTQPSGTARTGAPPNGGGFGSNRPSTFPSGAAGNVRAGRVIGTVASVSGTTVTVNEVTFAGRGASPSPSSTPTTTTQARTVDLTATTTYTTTQKATSAALVVGKCAVAQGEPDSAGILAATSIEVTEPVDGSCTGGFVRRTGGGGNANGSTSG